MHIRHSQKILLRGSRMARAILLLTAFCAFDVSAHAQSQGNPYPRVVPANSHAHGANYGEWSARWWKWALEQPAALSPLADLTGANCAIGQSGSVWFLAGTFQIATPVSRMCTIPPGKTLFFPVANAFYSAEGSFAEMQARAIADVNTASDLIVIVDGKSLTDLKAYRALSPEFTLRLPAGNIFEVPEDDYAPSASDGYYVMLTPLTPGTHIIQIKATFPTSVIDVTYTINVSR